MSLMKIIRDHTATEKSFKFFTTDHKVDIIFNDFDNDWYKLITLVRLDGVPIMIATSKTKHNNDLFLQILKDAKHIPTETKLFNKPGIKRQKMTVSHSRSSNIHDSFIASYLRALDFEHNVYIRKSIFSYASQEMELKEYVLPGLKFIIKKYS